MMIGGKNIAKHKKL